MLNMIKNYWNENKEEIIKAITSYYFVLNGGYYRP